MYTECIECGKMFNRIIHNSLVCIHCEDSGRD
jgi:hypothetical protein